MVSVCVCVVLLPASAIAEGEAIIQEALSQADNPHHLTTTCTAGLPFAVDFYYDFFLFRLTSLSSFSTGNALILVLAILLVICTNIYIYSYIYI